MNLEEEARNIEQKAEDGFVAWVDAHKAWALGIAMFAIAFVATVVLF